MKRNPLVISLLSIGLILSGYLYSSGITQPVFSPNNDAAEKIKQESITKDAAIQYITYFRSTETAVRSVIKSVWIDDAIIKYIVQNQANLNGLRIYIAKYQEGGAGGLPVDDPRIGKFTVILTPTVSSAKNGDPDDTDYFNYGSLCPQTCNGDVVGQPYKKN